MRREQGRDVGDGREGGVSADGMETLLSEQPHDHHHNVLILKSARAEQHDRRHLSCGPLVRHVHTIGGKTLAELVICIGAAARAGQLGTCAQGDDPARDVAKRSNGLFME